MSSQGTMLLTEEELAIITLKSPFVYEYGDMPYFRRCINASPLHFFARYRSNKDDPSQHRWSRVQEVVHRHATESSRRDVDLSASAVPLKWKEKYFFIALRIEGEDKCVELPRLSSKLPTSEEVMAYCSSRAELYLQDGHAGGDVMGVTARAQLPTAQEIANMKAFRQNVIVNHQWTSEEIEEVRERNERMGRVGAGSAPVRLTVTSLHNKRLETELGITSSRHAAGQSAMAMERRSSIKLNLQKSADSPGTPLHTPSQSLWKGATTLADLTPASANLSLSLSQESLQRWEASKQDAERFYAYVSDEHRSAYMTKIARMTLQNYEKNKRDRLRGIANEKRLDRKGNLLESGGLWIVDDHLRARLAHEYQMEQDGETATTAKTKTTVAGAASGAQSSAKDNEVGNSSEEDVALTPASGDAMMSRFKSQRQSQELSFASVPDEFMVSDVSQDLSSGLFTKDGTKSFVGNKARQLPPSSCSPELLLMDANPKFVGSQLLHRAVSGAIKRAASSSCASPDIMGRSQSEVLSVNDEPPKKASRYTCEEV